MIKKDKRGLSAVISILIIIGLTIVAGSIIWGVARSIIQERIDYSESCSLAVLDNIRINTVYTCYDNTEKKVKVMVDLGDIDVDEILIYVNYIDESRTVNVTQEKNSGKIHEVSLTDLFGDKVVESIGPGAVRIAPIVNGQQCSIVDNFYQIPGCS
jgi:hypothetical protein